MNIIELERHHDRIEAGLSALAHLTWVIVTRSAAFPEVIYTVWLADGPELRSRYVISQTARLGWAAQVARACADR